MEHRDRATGWHHAKLSGHENENRVKWRLDHDEFFSASLLSRMKRPYAHITDTTVGGLHETNVPSVNGRKTKSKTDLRVYVDTGEVFNISIKKSLGGQVYLIGAESFIDIFGKQFYTEIPSDVQKAIKLFWDADVSAVDILEQYGDRTIQKNYELQRKHRSLNAESPFSVSFRISSVSSPISQFSILTFG